MVFASSADHPPGEEDPDAGKSAAGVLTDRMAAALVHREPGWKLPRRSALARRFSVSLAEIDVAVEELSRRSLLRKRESPLGPETVRSTPQARFAISSRRNSTSSSARPSVI